jgi:hypothetical protein
MPGRPRFVCQPRWTNVKDRTLEKHAADLRRG